MILKSSIAVLAGLLILPVPLVAGPRLARQTDQRPSVGLALSGGGARGLSHIGVLRWLEQNRVPIDFIAGTSMGGVIGALHATGADSDDISEFVAAIDWERTLRGTPSYEELAFRRREDLRAFPSRYELGLRDGFRLPVALDPGHATGLLLDQIALPYSFIESYDELPTPFRCVAVDLLDGSPVVFARGPLGVALRATMAFPGLFAPVRHDGMVLADGGILNNLPTDVVRQMGADVVIAVDLGRPDTEPEMLDSLPGVLSRSVDLMTRSNVEPNLALADVVLQPAVEQFDFFDFERAEELGDLGFREAEQQRDLLARLAIDEASWDRYRSRRRERVRRTRPTPEFVTVTGVTGPDLGRIQTALSRHVGQSLDIDRLHTDLTRITGWGKFDKAGYEATRNEGREGLLIRVGRKSHGPPFLLPLIDVKGAKSTDTSFTLGGRITLYDVVGPDSEWRTDLTVGFRDQAATELYRPIGRSGWFVAPWASIANSTQLFFSDGIRIAELGIKETLAGVDLGYGTGLRGELRLGLRGGHQHIDVDIGDPALPSFSGTTAAARATWTFDDLDSPFIPTRGELVHAELEWVAETPGDAGAFPRARAEALAARRLSPRLSALGLLGGGTTFADEAPVFEDFLLGGPGRLGALGLQELRGDHFVFAGLGALFALAPTPVPFLGKPYLGALYEVGDAFDDRLDLFHDVTAGLFSETGLGVLFVGGALGESGRGQAFFSFGRFF